MFLRGVTATGAVRLLGAKLGGVLSCSGATFRAEKDAAGNPGYALSADGLDAQGGVFLRGVKATGAVRLLGATLGGNLDCGGATFRAERDAAGNPGHALSADGLEAQGGVFLRGVKATGRCGCSGRRWAGTSTATARRSGRRRMRRGSRGMRCPPTGSRRRAACSCAGSRRRGRCGCSGRRWAGTSHCGGATFRAERDAAGNPGDALSADRLEAKGSVFLRGVAATGAVRLLGAKLGGNLDCIGATFRAEKDAAGNPGYALSLEGAKVNGAFFLRDDARVVGVASLAGVEVGSLDRRSRMLAGTG